MAEMEEQGSRWFVELGAAILGVLIGGVLIWFVSCRGSAQSKTKRAAPVEAPTSTTQAPPMPTTTCPPPVEPAEPVQ